MRCEACMQLLDDFIDRELPEIEHRKVEQHINECVRCDREAEFLRILSCEAASLPKSIQPDRDLWPGIEAKIIAAPLSKNDWCASADTNLERKHSKAAAWGWRIAAAAMLASLVLAGTYLEMRKQTAKHSNQGMSSNATAKQSSEPAQPPSTRSLDNRQSAPAEHKTGIPASPDIQAFSTQPPAGILTYPLDPISTVFVSNYGIYGVRLDLDPSLDVIHNSIIRFDQNGPQSWIPPLPPGSMLRSLYAEGGNRLWIAYAVQQPEFQTCIAELDFGAESQIRNVWKSGNLNISRFVIGPQGLIYAAGFRKGDSKAIAKLTRGQSITAEPVHIIDPATGEERHLSPITIRPRFDSPSWAGQTRLEMTALAPTIAVKSNGNFFLTIDRNSAPASVRDLIKNEAVEYSPDGTVARTWKLGALEPNTYLNKIFVDVDDSILAEIVRYPDTSTADSSNGTIVDRYLLRVGLDARITRYELSFPLDEAIQGWMGQTQDVVTIVRGGQPAIRIHRLSP